MIISRGKEIGEGLVSSEVRRLREVWILLVEMMEGIIFAASLRSVKLYSFCVW